MDEGASYPDPNAWYQKEMTLVPAESGSILIKALSPSDLPLASM